MEQKDGQPPTPQRNRFGPVMRASHDRIANYIRRSNPPEGDGGLVENGDAAEGERQNANSPQQEADVPAIVDEAGPPTAQSPPREELPPRAQSPVVVIFEDSPPARENNNFENPLEDGQLPVRAMNLYEMEDEEFFDLLAERDRRVKRKAVGFAYDQRSDASNQSSSGNSSSETQTDNEVVATVDQEVQCVAASRESSTQALVYTRETSVETSRNISREMGVQNGVNMAEKETQVTSQIGVQTVSVGVQTEVSTAEVGCQHERVLPQSITELFDSTYRDRGFMEGFRLGIRCTEEYLPSRIAGYLNVPLQQLFPIEAALASNGQQTPPTQNLALVQHRTPSAQSYYNSAPRFNPALNLAQQYPPQPLFNPNPNQPTTSQNQQLAPFLQAQQQSLLQQLLANQQRQNFGMNQFQQDVHQNRQEAFGFPTNPPPFNYDFNSSSAPLNFGHRVPDISQYNYDQGHNSNFQPFYQENPDVQIIPNEPPQMNRGSSLPPEATFQPANSRQDLRFQHSGNGDQPVAESEYHERISVSTPDAPVAQTEEAHPENVETSVAPTPPEPEQLRQPEQPEQREELVQVVPEPVERFSCAGRPLRSCQVVRVESFQPEADDTRRATKRIRFPSSTTSATTVSSSPPPKKKNRGRKPLPKKQTPKKSTSKRATSTNRRKDSTSESSEEEDEPSTSAPVPPVRGELGRLQSSLKGLEPADPIRKKRNSKDFRRPNRRN